MTQSLPLLPEVTASRLAAWHPDARPRRWCGLSLAPVTVGSWCDLLAAGLWSAPTRDDAERWELAALAWRHSPHYRVGSWHRIAVSLRCAMVPINALRIRLFLHCTEPFADYPQGENSQLGFDLYRDRGVEGSVWIVHALRPWALRDIRALPLHAAFQLLRCQRMEKDAKYQPPLHPLYRDLIYNG